MNYVTVAELNCMIQNNLFRIPRTVDLVVGIPRSGMLVASLLALYLNLPMSDIDAFSKGEIYSCGNTKKDANWISNLSEARHILFVEDSSCSGRSIQEAKEKIQNNPYRDKILFLAAIVTKETKKNVDISFVTCEPPRIFEWNMFHHQQVSKMCFDLDGVLCVDPTEEQNDDGEKYRDFVLHAPLKIKPTFEIGYIITSRLEKYRDITEQWLKANGIRYKELIMMQYATKEERVKSGSHGKYKGEQYKHLRDTNLFIESNPIQAQEIAFISGKTVYCTENNNLIKDSTLHHYYEAIQFNYYGSIRGRIARILPRKLKITIKKLRSRR